jgi:hypothetical protein
MSEGRRPRLGALLSVTLVHDGGMHTLADVGGELVELMIAIDVDGLGGGIEDHFTVFALSDVMFYLGQEFGGNGTIEEVGKLRKKISARHEDWPSFFCRK